MGRTRFGASWTSAAILSVCTAACGVGEARAQATRERDPAAILQRRPQAPPDRLREPIYRVSQQPTAAAAAAAAVPQAVASRPDLSLLEPDEHPLMPALRWAKASVVDIRQVQDYSCQFVKRERVDGELKEHEYMFMKVRHRPFSVYLYFLGPPALRGQEVIFVEGKNDGKMYAHTTGLKDKMFGTVSLLPTGIVAMQGNRYPVTEAGFLHLVERLIQIGEQDTKFGECEVKYYQGAKINGRKCTCIQVMHPVPRRNFLFHMARIFVDDELNIPVRYEAYSWPEKAGANPVLIEEYTYTNVKLNNSFTDLDFDTSNSQYNFR